MRILKCTAALFLTVLWAALCGLYSYAAADNVVWAAVNEQKAVLYLPQEAQKVTECLVGSVRCSGIRTKEISNLEHPVHTLILLDNSLSIPKDSRETISKILQNLIGNRMQGELYTIATISDDIRYLCTAESDYLSLGSAIDSITYENQNTQLSDRVYEAVQKLHESDVNQFCRVVIISDGVDDKQIGYTHTELENLLRSCGYPIYTVGCGSNDTEERRTRLENLFALSRVNRGQTFYLGDTTDTFAIAKGICEYNTAQQVVVTLPDEVCDGSVRALQITSEAGVYSTQLEMPFVAAPAASASVASSAAPSEAASSAAPVEQEADSSIKDKLPLIALAGGGAVVVVGAVIAAVVLLKRKKDAAKEETVEKEEPPKRGGSVIVTVDDGVSSIQQAWNAPSKPVAPPVQVPPVQVQNPGRNVVREATPPNDTIRMFSKTASGRTLCLANLNNPACTYEVPLKGTVRIGRNPDCNLVLDRPSVSKYQCEISVQEGRAYIRNLSSTNRTQVNGHPLMEAEALPETFTLTMGNEKMKAVIR